MSNDSDASKESKPMTIAHARKSQTVSIYGTGWTSTTQQQLKISLTIGIDEFLLTEQEWKNLASVTNQALALFTQPLSPEVALTLLANTLTIDP